MGPGIVRILAEYPEIQLENDASAKEFKVIIKRIIQKREVATQKRETATQKGQFEDIDTTQKRETATQKGQFEDIDTTQKKEIATQKNLNTTQKKVLEYFKDNPKATRVDAANALGNITEDGVKFIIAKLQAKAEGICQPILLGNPDRLNRVASRLKLDLSDIEIIDMRADNEQGRRATFAKHLAEKRAREGYTFEEAYDKMYERNYFGMSLVEQGDADAFITGLYTKYSNTIKVAKEVIGIRPEFKTFGTMHILNTQKGVFYIADTLINRHPDEDVLTDIAKLSAHTVKFFNEEPVIAMLSYSNFGTDAAGSPVKVHKAVAEMQKAYPDLAIDGEMQVNYALNKKLRDEKYPFSRLKGKDVNTLVFPNLSSANASYKLLQALNPEAEIIGPIQMGLNKPIHFTDSEGSVQDIVNITAVAVIDAYVEKIKNNSLKRLR